MFLSVNQHICSIISQNSHFSFHMFLVPLSTMYYSLVLINLTQKKYKPLWIEVYIWSFDFSNKSSNTINPCSFCAKEKIQWFK